MIPTIQNISIPNTGKCHDLMLLDILNNFINPQDYKYKTYALIAL